MSKYIELAESLRKSDVPEPMVETIVAKEAFLDNRDDWDKFKALPYKERFTAVQMSPAQPWVAVVQALHEIRGVGADNKLAYAAGTLNGFQLARKAVVAASTPQTEAVERIDAAQTTFVIAGLVKGTSA